MAVSSAVTVGRKAPAFALPNQQGDTARLSDYEGKWVVLYFYPKDDTPGCTTEACDFTDNLSRLDKLNAVVLGVSPDSVESHARFVEKHNLKVTLLSDPEKKVLQMYGAFGEKMMYGKATVGVIRSTYLIDPGGRIAYAWPNVKATGHAEKVAAKLAELAQR
ncbi:MAG TPA: thioredoxin-dependent thiol peroxidase [candidate division Zixibacteria bacterium]|nr:thioredoxin-dependent thiol peroxidase [candidate division Zixibacteria bacterium]MDD4918827.1 thioredoxin-dependent thiol peroxidase [candidate division Zixibacteria bacterium]MDM7973632.1 thioredoxin-dependent thiol peroxidase [candidate division Zixibacteria bacterium]HOD66500.1 thioredoxin-dependent thiol peroxidase [candidate division Zixibacteria bacterium]HOZ06958.1 thioredoxin-dependent thiol peroxidase [candidate division Zixibacteria bacterium]